MSVRLITIHGCIHVISTISKWCDAALMWLSQDYYAIWIVVVTVVIYVITTTTLLTVSHSLIDITIPCDQCMTVILKAVRCNTVE